jgi:signal transduction histidine kinase
MTILIVDDNESNLYQLQVLLGGNGYQIVTAANGAEALAKARQNPPDLVISDVLMPVMDGFALCHEWKKDERLRQISFVFYTATYTDERDQEFALSLGAERFLIKPEEPEVFIQTIREVIQQLQHPPAPPAANAPARLPVEEPPREEFGYLRQYNEVLIRKLEAKMQQLEQTNRELERDVTERKRAEAALRQMSGRLLRLQDEERRRIARELHDTIAQSLTALALNLSVVKDSAPDLSPRAKACLSESLGLAEECSREIRTLSYLLHPPLLDDTGLGSALRWFVDGYAQRTGIHVDLEMPPGLTRLPGDVELALYRVAQEGLTNIHRHSGSKMAHICLKCRPDQVVLTVADEGRGLPPGFLERGDPRAAKRGVGISGMRERVRQLGGQFEIVTGSNGTTLTAIVPLREEPA